MKSAIYRAEVMHRRFQPRGHRFSYGVFYGLFDLDELPELDRRVRGFGVNRRAPIAFHEADHGPRDGSPLRPWLEAALAEAEIDLEGGPIRILAMPRILGHVFNPIAVWFAYGPSEDLRAVLYEVANTFGERLAYLCPVGPNATDGAGTVRHRFAKQLFVSPFIDMDAAYDFRTRPPDDRVALLIREAVDGAHLLTATMVGRRRTFSTAELWSAFVRYPLVTLKVVAAIHGEALRLWRKGAPYRRRGPAPTVPYTIERAAIAPVTHKITEPREESA